MPPPHHIQEDWLPEVKWRQTRAWTRVSGSQEPPYLLGIHFLIGMMGTQISAAQMIDSLWKLRRKSQHGKKCLIIGSRWGQTHWFESALSIIMSRSHGQLGSLTNYQGFFFTCKMIIIIMLLMGFWRRQNNMRSRIISFALSFAHSKCSINVK